MYKLNFNHLYYFLTISNEGSIVKAAKKLHISQPAMSHQLRLLEEDLGKKLFDRVGKRLVLNKNGEAVKEYAHKIFRQSDEMIQSLRSDSERYIKILKIGTVPWLSKDQTYEFIKPLLFSQHIRVEVYQKDLEALIGDVKESRIDIVLCDSPYSGRSKKLQGHRLKTDPIVCVASSKSLFRGKFPQCIEGKKIISYSEACMMADKIDDFLKTNRINIQSIGAFSDTSLIRVAASKGGVAAFLPLSVVKQNLKRKSLVKLGEIGHLKFSLWAITRKSDRKDDLISSLISKGIKDKRQQA